MKAVRQAILGKGEEALARGEVPGDCMRAAIASIFEQPLEAVPHFVNTGPTDDDRLWWWALVGWCYAHGADIRPYKPGHPDAPGGWMVLAGPGPRGHRHLVVGYDGELAHDPHPSGDGLLDVESWWCFQPLTPGAAILLGYGS